MLYFGAGGGVGFTTAGAAGLCTVVATGATGFCAPFLFFFGFLFSLPCLFFSPMISLPFTWLLCLTVSQV